MTDPKIQKIVNRINKSYERAVHSKKNPELSNSVRSLFQDVVGTFDVLTKGGKLSAAKIANLDETIQHEILINQLKPFVQKGGAIKAFKNISQKVVWLENKLDRNLSAKKTKDFWDKFHRIERSGDPYEEGDNTYFILVDEIAHEYNLTLEEIDRFLEFHQDIKKFSSSESMLSSLRNFIPIEEIKEEYKIEQNELDMFFKTYDFKKGNMPDSLVEFIKNRRDENENKTSRR